MNIAKFGLLLGVFFIAACSENGSMTSVQEASAPEVDDRPVYRAVRDVTYPPYLLTVHSGEHAGLEVDILNAVAKQQGFKIEYIVQPWDKLFTNLKELDIHISLGGTSIEDVNQEVSIPTRPYVVSLDCLIGRSKEDLHHWWKKKIAITEFGEWKDTLIQDYGMKVENIRTVDTHYQVMTEVLKKNAEIGLGDCVAMRYHIASETFDDTPLLLQAVPGMEEDDSTRIVFSVRKDEPELLAKINAGLEALQKNGELDAIKARWKQ